MFRFPAERCTLVEKKTGGEGPVTELAGPLLSFALAIPFGLVARRRLSKGHSASPAHQKHRVEHPVTFRAYTVIWGSIGVAFAINGISALAIALGWRSL
jgi:hypothetical protein